MENDQNFANWFKLALAWIFTGLGHLIEWMTLGKLCLFMTFVLTSLQVYVLCRDRVFRKENYYDDERFPRRVRRGRRY